MLAPPSGGRIYHAAFPDLGGAEDWVRKPSIRRFERLAGRRLAWVYFSNNWWDGRIRFPRGDVRRIVETGRVPFVRLMARSDYGRGPDANFSMDSLVDGEWDPQLRRWCTDAAAAIADLDTPLLAEFGTEVNGDWFPWNGRWNGGGATAGYGDPGEPDGPERFRDAYRHLVELCRDEGATSITWFFHIDVGSSPSAAWNSDYANYYPGDDYVDWIGISDYGKLKPREPSHSFAARLDRRYEDITALSSSKPIAVLEYGHAEARRPARKAKWIRRAIHAVAAGRWPRIAALSYWHEAWHNGDGSLSDLHIDSSKRSLRAYRHAVHARRFSSKPSFAPR
jgi:hypothetical protein